MIAVGCVLSTRRTVMLLLLGLGVALLVLSAVLGSGAAEGGRTRRKREVNRMDQVDETLKSFSAQMRDVLEALAKSKTEDLAKAETAKRNLEKSETELNVMREENKKLRKSLDEKDQQIRINSEQIANNLKEVEANKKNAQTKDVEGLKELEKKNSELTEARKEIERLRSQVNKIENPETSNGPEVSKMNEKDSAILKEKAIAELKAIAASRRQAGVDCAAVARNDTRAVTHAQRYANKTVTNLTQEYAYRLDNETVAMARDCPYFVKHHGFVMNSVSKEEEDFPIAFTIVAYKDIEMFIRLFRQIYRPHNYYCFHIDIKSPSLFAAVSAITSCFPNAVLASRRGWPEWGSWAIIDAEFSCMEVLWQFKKWRYFINLTGQEFPLKTNYELVKILKAYKGANDVRGTNKFAKKFRWGDRQLPHNMTGYKSPVHVTVNRDFVDYVLHAPQAQDLKAFFRKTWMPDEGFWGPLNHNPHLNIHGSYIGLYEEERKNGATMDVEAKQSFNRYKMWDYLQTSKKVPYFCANNKITRWICILSIGDLPYLLASPQLIANKFYLHQDRVVIGCLEEALANRTLAQARGDLTFDTSLYATSDLVRHRVINDPTGKWDT